MIKIEDGVYETTYKKGGRVGYYNNLRDLLELRDNGTKTIILNGFRENIGYVIDLKLDDQDLIKIEDGVYETTYKKGGQIELFADGGEIIDFNNLENIKKGDFVAELDSNNNVVKFLKVLKVRDKELDFQYLNSITILPHSYSIGDLDGSYSFRTLTETEKSNVLGEPKVLGFNEMIEKLYTIYSKSSNFENQEPVIVLNTYIQKFDLPIIKRYQVIKNNEVVYDTLEYDFMKTPYGKKNYNYSDGGGVDDCIEYIKNSESIKDNGYYLHIDNMYNYVGSNSLNIPKINSLCLITFNSGGQKNLKAVDTINSILLSSEIAKLLNIDIEIARIIVSEQITFSKPFTMNMLDDIENKNIIIADRDTIVCTNLSMQSNDSEYKSAFNSKQDFLKGKTELERIEDLKKEVSKNKWSREALTEESGIVKVYSRMYDLDKETVASIFNEYQKKYADGGDMDDISLAKSNAIHKIDFEYYAKEYAGDSWDKMSDSEKAELMRDIRENWFNDYEYADGGETEFPIYTYGKIDGKPFEVIGVNYKTGIVKVKNFSEYGIKEMTISEWIPLTFELGTPASFVENGREVSGEVVMRDGKRAISLYKDDNYGGDSERIRFFNEIDLTTLKSFMDRETFSLGGFLLGAGAGVLGHKLYLQSKTKKGKEKIQRTYNKVKKKVGL